MLFIGAHMSIAKGFSAAARATLAIGGNTLQFFSRNPRGSGIRALDDKDIEGFKSIRASGAFGPIVAHAPYTLNLAAAEPRVYEFAIEVIESDLPRMDKLGIEHLNIHPGSHVGAGIDAGTVRIIEGLEKAFEQEGQTMLLLETMSGRGSEIGYTFAQLNAIIAGLNHHKRVGVCMDLCHMYAAGYDIVNDLDGVVREFDSAVGLDRLKAVHLNDSMHPLGSHKDRHAVIGAGHIGLDATLRLMRHEAFQNIPFLLETPLEDEGHQKEIALLRELLEIR